MQQNITVEQLNKLSKKGKKRLREWWKPNDIDLSYSSLFGVRIYASFFNKNDIEIMKFSKKNDREIYPLLSIGQLIEFLIEYEQKKYGSAMYLLEEYSGVEDEDGLCDALWESVKEVLEK